jgi:hypothetical protein
MQRKEQPNFYKIVESTYMYRESKKQFQEGKWHCTEQMPI